ncbi:hypothetical protein B0A55_03481 [Friedmanniomyces simplex]|uniref:Myb-like domain-containing protein n=1 Tax=Friedmanniomyces simplex TaxID=329884 RepID=A0A4U0XTV0_9PEZI|nr:hypothetical protein B0A55_03481 [Friedmanniomyces simplex]
MAKSPTTPTAPTTPTNKFKRKSPEGSKNSGTRKVKAPKLTAADYENGKERGFIKPQHSRVQKMKWTVANDRKLLLFGLQRAISPKQFPAIAASFTEQPSAKSIQEQLSKLRKEQLAALDEIELEHPTLAIADLDSEDDVSEEEYVEGDVEVTGSH